MKSGISTHYPLGVPREAPRLWVSIGDRTCGYFAGEVAFHLEGPIEARRRATAEALRKLADQFEATP